MAYKNLQHFIRKLEESNEIVRIKEYVSPYLEIAEITDRVVKNGGKALLFENTGTNFPVLINAFGSDRRMCLALDVSYLDEIGEKIDKITSQVFIPKTNWLDKIKMLPTLKQMADWLPKNKTGRGSCQEIVMENPDITKLPVLTCWVHDGGPFITLPVVHTVDPVSGIRNVGMYRMQVFDEKMTGMHWHLHKNSARHYRDYKKLKQRMPVTVTLGGDPVCTYAATAPMPDNVDEYLFAGFLRDKPVQMVKCLTNDLFIPENVDFVIEGYVDPEEELILEGPFGDHTGYYSLADYYPRFHITCITHRRDAVYPATVVGIPLQEDAWIAKATERIFVKPIKISMVPEIVDIHMPFEGVFHNLTIVKINKTYAGQSFKVMNALWGAGQMMFNKVFIITDAEVDIQNSEMVIRAINENVQVGQDIFFSKGPSDVLDHSSRKFTLGGKMGIDATVKLESEIYNQNLFLKPECDSVKLKNDFEEIKIVNDSLLNTLSLIIISLSKNRRNHIRKLHEQLIQKDVIKNVKFIVYTDDNLDVSRFGDVVWQVSNNIDPVADCFLDVNNAILAIDGTRKTEQLDGFTRQWPNAVVSDKATRKKVDEMWDKLGIGPFISSPSETYEKLLIGDKEIIHA